MDKNKPQPKALPKASVASNLKEDESEGEVEEDIVRNQSKKFGESQEFGQSQGYDITVDSIKLEEYDYYEEIEE